MEEKWFKIALAVICGALAGLGILGGFLNVNWSQIFVGV